MNVNCAQPLAEFISKFSWRIIAINCCISKVAKCHNFNKTKITKTADELHKVLSSNYLYNLSLYEPKPSSGSEITHQQHGAKSLVSCS